MSFPWECLKISRLRSRKVPQWYESVERSSGSDSFMGFDEVGRFFLFFISTLLYVLNFAIIIRALMSWFNPSMENPIVRFVIEITEPVLAPLRRIVPRIGMIDITPIVAILLMNVILQVLESTLR